MNNESKNDEKMEKKMENNNKLIMDKETLQLAEEADEFLKEMIAFGGYEKLIKGMVNLGAFSLRNQALIHKQRPDSTELKGMRAWNYFARYINSGEKGIESLSPVFENHENNPDKKGPIKLGALTGFRIHYLFDISQTEGAPYHSPKCNKGEATKYFDKIVLALEESLSWRTKEGLEIKHSLDDVLFQMENQGYLNDDEKLGYLISSVGDKMIRRKMASSKYSGISETENKDIKYIMKSAVCYIALNRLNIETEELEIPDIYNLSDTDYEGFKENLNIIRQISQTLVNSVETVVALARKEELKRKAVDSYGKIKASGKTPFDSYEEIDEQEGKGPRVA